MLTKIDFGSPGDSKTLAILVPLKDMKPQLLLKHYVNPLGKLGIPPKEIIVFNLEHNEAGKAPVKIINEYLLLLEKLLKHHKIKTIMVADSAYFKKICDLKQSRLHLGSARITQWQGISGFILPNYRQLFFNPMIQAHVDMALEAASDHLQGGYGIFPTEVIRETKYPVTATEINQELDKLSKLKALTCDIEALGLQLTDDIWTISFSKDQHSGVAFKCTEKPIQELLRLFFLHYKGKLIFHSATFDTKMLIYQLFMEHPRDITGMLQGLECLHHNLEDTKIIAYLALNSAGGNKLSLKELAFPYLGNYGLEEIANIQAVPIEETLAYNIKDTAGTWYVYNKYRAGVIATQKDAYKNVFLPALKVITQMELIGMPMDMAQVCKTDTELSTIRDMHLGIVLQHPIVTAFTETLRELAATVANKKLVKLVKTAADFPDLEFNPGSSKQLGYLLYTYLKLPVTRTTPTGAASCDGKALKQAAISAAKNPDAVQLIEHIREYLNVIKICDTFIPAFLDNTIHKDFWDYLHGSFILGGPISSRLSSRNPNLQNIPSTGTVYAKPIKQCFRTPSTLALSDNPYGWLMVGADFRALESIVMALLTKDPNMLKVFTDGYCGHCLRAYRYYGHHMTGIDPNSVKSINSIKTKYPDFRQRSKGVSFALQYMGTWRTLVKNFGLPEDEARAIEIAYHEMYYVADEWVMDRIRKASKTGYVELAFGVRLRTPILTQVLVDNYAALPYQAYKEIKSAGNALGQSYGLLNTRAANEFMGRVWKSDYSEVVLPISQIHDAQYYMIQNSLDCLEWVNNNLINCMEWNQLPAIAHPTIKLGAELEMYYPTWAEPHIIPNGISQSQILDITSQIEAG